MELTDAREIGSLLTHFAVAFVLALPIGWERETASRSAGLRTFTLVALASCGYTVIGLQAVGPGAEAQARVLQGLMTGIGFIGGGAILKQDKVVHGTATAASIWTTGALGAAAGHGQYATAFVLSLITLTTLGVLTRLERRIDRGRQGDAVDQS